MTPRAVFFDFDGTLVDTFDGIIAGVQTWRATLNAPPLPPLEVRRHIGWGLPNLLRQTHPGADALRPDRLPHPTTPIAIPPAELEAMIRQWRQLYAAVMLRDARVYPGIGELCADLAAGGTPLAVISNKPERFVRQILAALALSDPFRVVLGGDTLPAQKPDPAPLSHAAQQLRVALEHCIMVGDGEADISVARAAGIPSCGVTWGLHSADEMRRFGPTHLAQDAQELRACLESPTLR